MLHDLFSDIIRGDGVKRAKHELLWEGKDLTEEFVRALTAHGYLPMILRNIPVEVGERVPAFFLEDTSAYFGWVFWEKFTHLKLRKLFGSVVRNEKGDWAVQIPAQRMTVIYANVNLKIEMDIDHPSGF